MKKFVFWLAALAAFVLSCNNPNRSEPGEIADLKRELSNLESDEALMKVRVGEKDFYSENMPFKTNVLLLPQSFKVGFLNKEGGNVEMEMIRDSWFEEKPINFSLTNSNLGESGGDQVIVMIGKLTDEMALQGEGYFLVNGKIEVPELSRQVITIVFKGNLVKPGQASTVENYVPVEGWIVVKEPDFSDQSSAEILKQLDEK
ncbi:hypothetical protein [Persicitalea sp.]|uniref:hypothetical protein n=1 Tax=Persicitalea sp. TaxID=3100273 RepID=UPI0035948382